MLNFAINVHHNVTQFPQDLTLHKPRRRSNESSIWATVNGTENELGNVLKNGNGNESGNVRALCAIRIKSKAHNPFLFYFLNRNRNCDSISDRD